MLGPFFKELLGGGVDDRMAEGRLWGEGGDQGSGWEAHLKVLVDRARGRR